VATDRDAIVTGSMLYGHKTHPKWLVTESIAQIELVSVARKCRSTNIQYSNLYIFCELLFSNPNRSPINRIFGVVAGQQLPTSNYRWFALGRNSFGAINSYKSREKQKD